MRSKGASPGFTHGAPSRRVLPRSYARPRKDSYGEPVSRTDLSPRRRILRPLPPFLADAVVAAVVALFTGPDAEVNDPGHRQADEVTWLLFAVSVGALLVRTRWPVGVAVVTGAACAGRALYGHIGELLNLPVMVALYTVAVRGNRTPRASAGSGPC
ncbi:DUF7134 domain-containing protein [Streptomyces pseudogriseolus]|uniref:DUF7134 domain-containing protein n=1 Tax=Streptomyces pseudogriseolus TaxID=36817 RepID=UPI003FA2F14B